MYKRQHPLDGIVFIPNCDKIVPGMIMAAARMNLPSICVSGGPMNPGRVQGKRVGYNEIYEAIGQYSNGTIGDDVLPVSYTHLDVYKRQG